MKLKHKWPLVAILLTLLQGLALSAAELKIWDSYKFLNFAGNTVEYGGPSSEGSGAVGDFKLYSDASIGDNVLVPPSQQILMAETISSAGGDTLEVNLGSVTSGTAPSGVTLDFKYSGGSLSVGTGALTTAMIDHTGFANIDSLMLAYSGYSDFLEVQPANGIVHSNDLNNVVFEAIPGQEHTYFSISGDLLENANGVSVLEYDNKSVVVNVTGDDLVIHANSLSHYADVIWNFTGTNVKFTGNTIWDGAILNPEGTVDTQKGSRGLVVGNVLKGDQTWEYNYINAPKMTQVPEVSASGLISVAAGLCLTRRRRP